MNYLTYFIQQVENEKKFSNGSIGCLIPIAILIVWRYSGLIRKDVAKLFKCDRAMVTMSIKRQIKYEEVSDPKFIINYNKLLDLYIQSTRFFIKTNHNS